MAATMTASIEIKLKDKELNSGLDRLTRKLEGLGRLTEKLSSIGHLNAMLDAFDRLSGSATKAARSIAGVTAKAQEAHAAIRAMGEVSIRVNSAGVAQLPQQMRGIAVATALAAAGIGAGMAPGIMPPPMGPPGRSAPFMGPQGVPLMLAGAGGGGIPLAPLAGMGWGGPDWGAMRGRAAAFRGELGHMRHEFSALGREASHVGHGLMGAAAGAFGLGEPIREFAHFENAVRHIAITTGVASDQVSKVTGELMAQYRQLALATAQSSEKVAESANFLITTGIGRENVDKMLPLIARASTAYNTNMQDSVQAVFSLRENLHVPDAELAGTISAMAQAGKEGHFSFANFSQFLPNIAPAAATAGFKGAEGARKLMAMLETSRRNAGTPGEAETNLRDFIGNIFSPSADKHFAALGVNLPSLRLDAERKGINPAEAVIAKVLQLTKGRTDAEATAIIGKLFHNQQARQFLVGMRADLEYYQKTLGILNKSDEHTIDHDYDKAQNPETKLRQLTEKLTQIVQRFGEGFASLLDPMNGVLDRLLAWQQAFDQASPGTLNTVLSWAGGFVALTVALGVLVPVLKLAFGGMKLLLSPVTLLWSGLRLLVTAAGYAFAAFQMFGLGAAVAGGLVVAAVAAIAGAAYLIYEHWDAVGPWFMRLWDSLADILHGAWDVIAGIFTLDGPRIVAGFKRIWYGLGAFFTTMWSGITDVFDWFWSFLTEWTSGALTGAVKGIKDAWNGMAAFFARLISDWTKPFDDLIARLGNLERKIAEVVGGAKNVLGLGPAAPAGSQPEGDPEYDAMGNPTGMYKPRAAAPGASAFGSAISGAALAPPVVNNTVNVHITPNPATGKYQATADDPRTKVQVNRGEMARRD